MLAARAEESNCLMANSPANTLDATRMEIIASDVIPFLRTPVCFGFIEQVKERKIVGDFSQKKNVKLALFSSKENVSRCTTKYSIWMWRQEVLEPNSDPWRRLCFETCRSFIFRMEMVSTVLINAEKCLDRWGYSVWSALSSPRYWGGKKTSGIERLRPCRGLEHLIYTQRHLPLPFRRVYSICDPESYSAITKSRNHRYSDRACALGNRRVQLPLLNPRRPCHSRYNGIVSWSRIYN